MRRYVMPLRKLLIDCVKVITLVVLGLDVFWYKTQVGASEPRRLRRACGGEYCNNRRRCRWQSSSRQLIRPALHPIRGSRLQIRRLSRIFTRVALEQPHQLDQQRWRPHGFTRTFHIHQAHQSHQTRMCETTSPDRSIMTAFIHSTLFASLYICFFADRSHILLETVIA